MKCESRSYRQRARADQTRQTRDRLIAAAVAAWRDDAIGNVTLADIAAAAGTTQQTLIRHFGSKEGLIAATIAEHASGIEAARDAVPAGDVDAALDYLCDHYAADGAVVQRTIAAAAAVPEARAIAEHGRKVHRDWVARVFGPILPDPVDPVTLDALVAATDLSTWMLLREGLGRSAVETRTVMQVTVNALLQRPET